MNLHILTPRSLLIAILFFTTSCHHSVCSQQVIPPLCENKLVPNVETNCRAESAISCTIKETGENCKDYFSKQPSPECGKLDIMITYDYCNCNSEEGESIVVYTNKSYGLYRSQIAFGGDDMKQLLPNTCDSISQWRKIDTCNSFAKAEMVYGGYNEKYGIDNSNCWVFYKNKWDYPKPTKAPSPSPTEKQPTPSDPNICDAKALCILEDGTPCSGNIVKGKTCGYIPVKLLWRYCNNNYSSNFILSKDDGKCYVRLNGFDESMDKSLIPPNQCHELVEDAFLDTCRDNNIISMRIEGELQDGSGWCQKEDSLVIQTLTKSPTIAPTSAPTMNMPTPPNTNCNIEVKCKLPNGKPCAGNVVSGSKCEMIPVSLQYKYCNESKSSKFLPNASSDKSYIQVNKKKKSIELSSVPPNQCMQFTSTRYFNTCLKANIINMGIEGSFEGTNEWCRGQDQLTINTLPPVYTTDPDPVDGKLCKVQVSCSLKNGKPCLGNVYRNSSSCGKIPVEIKWKYCNKHTTATFIPDKTSDKCYMRVWGYDLPNMNRNPLLKGRCRSVTTKEFIDTCVDINEIEMRVEGTYDTLNQVCKSEKIIKIVTKKLN